MFLKAELIVFIGGVFINAIKPKFEVRSLIKKSPVKLGETVTLTCEVKCCDTGNNLRKWYAYGFQCLDEDCSSSHKYRVEISNSTNSFDLIISNFSETDLNVNYTCSFGFATSTLRPTSDIVIYEPLQHEIIDCSKTVNGTFHINMTIYKVYPEPVCYGALSENGYSVTGNKNYKINVSTVQKNSGGTRKVILTGTPNQDACKGRLIVECCLSTTPTTISNKPLDICQTDQGQRPNTNHTSNNTYMTTVRNTLFAVLPVAAFVIAVVVYLLYKNNQLESYQRCCKTDDSKMTYEHYNIKAEELLMKFY